MEAGTSELGGIQKHYLKCKDGVKKAKACQELNMAKDVKGYQQQKTKENVGPVLNEAGDPVAKRQKYSMAFLP